MAELRFKPSQSGSSVLAEPAILYCLLLHCYGRAVLNWDVILIQGTCFRESHYSICQE